MSLRIAIIGSGIAGLACAWLLSQRYQVTLFEADDRLGGPAYNCRLAALRPTTAQHRTPTTWSVS